MFTTNELIRFYNKLPGNDTVQYFWSLPLKFLKPILGQSRIFLYTNCEQFFKSAFLRLDRFYIEQWNMSGNWSIVYLMTKMTVVSLLFMEWWKTKIDNMTSIRNSPYQCLFTLNCKQLGLKSPQQNSCRVCDRDT